MGISNQVPWMQYGVIKNEIPFKPLTHYHNFMFLVRKSAQTLVHEYFLYFLIYRIEQPNEKGHCQDSAR